MKILLNYNFKVSDIDDDNFEQLYSKRRRDAGFVFAYERDGVTYALRDHLGIVPLYYRFLRIHFVFQPISPIWQQPVIC